jgi:NADH-quinone oxidoreductase subunit K
MIPLKHFLWVGSMLFGIGLIGIVLNRKNVITLLMCTELLLLGVNTNFIAFAQYLGDVGGEIFVFFILTVAAAEAAIGLAIVMQLFRNRGTIDVDKLTLLKG